MLAYFAYMQSTLGPLTPFLRAELDLSYTVTAMHLSAFALGMIAAGLLSDRLAARFGRQMLFWGGGAGMALGAVLLILGRQPAVTIASSLCMGLLGGFLIVMIQAALSDRHGALRALALTEANVVAAVFSMLAPLLIGLGEQSGLGWRIGLGVAVAACLLLFGVYRREPLPTATSVGASRDEPARAMPLKFWAYWLVLILCVSIEWCVVFWGADFMENAVGLERVTASTLMSVFFAAMVLGRWIGSRLTRIYESSRLLIYAVAIVLVGFPMFWLGTLPLINIAGLFIAGLGIANLFPLTLSVVTSVVPERSNTASARASLGSGLAILITPQLLGAFADQVGIQGAFGVAAVLLVIVLVITLAARRVPLPTPV